MVICKHVDGFLFVTMIIRDESDIIAIGRREYLARVLEFLQVLRQFHATKTSMWPAEYKKSDICSMRWNSFSLLTEPKSNSTSHISPMFFFFFFFSCLWYTLKFQECHDHTNEGIACFSWEVGILPKIIHR